MVKKIGDLEERLKKADPAFNPDTNVTHIYDAGNLDPIHPLSFAEIMAIKAVPTEYVIYPVLPLQGICFVYAASGMGKTLFTLNLAYCIAGGGNFLKYKCPLPRKVLYVDGEMAFNEVQKRLIDIKKIQGKLDDDNNFSLITPDQVLPRRVPKIDNPDGQQFYINIMQEYRYDVLVLDNLSMLSSLDENKSDEWQVIQDWLLYLRSIGKTVIVVHHAGKDKNGYRGTSRMLDCANTAISLQPISNDNLEDENVSCKKFRVEYQKSRDFSGADALPFEISLEQGVWRSCSIELSVLDKVVERVKIKMSQSEIAKELGVSQPYVNKLIKKARESCLLPLE